MNGSSKHERLKLDAGGGGGGEGTGNKNGGGEVGEQSSLSLCSRNIRNERDLN